MEPGSRADNPPDRTSLRFADIIGTLIALLTLVMPLVAISSFSSSTAGASFLNPPSGIGR